MRIYRENERRKERWRDGVEMGEGRLRQKERIDKENRLNQGGCVLVREAGGEGGGELQPQWLSGRHACRAFWLLYLIGSHCRAPSCVLIVSWKNADNGLSQILHWSRYLLQAENWRKRQRSQMPSFPSANYNKLRRHCIVAKTEMTSFEGFFIFVENVKMTTSWQYFGMHNTKQM